MTYSDRNILGIYLGFVALGIAGLFTSFYFQSPLPTLGCFGMLFLLVLLFFPTLAFPMLMLSMPLSVEYYFGSLGTDLPSEPLVIIIATITLFYVLTKNVSLKSFLAHPFTVIIFLLYIWAVATALFSTDPILSIKYLLAKGWYVIGFYMAAYIFTKDAKAIEKFFVLLFIPTLLGVIYVMFRHGGMGFTFDSINKACQPVFRNHVNYAIFMGMLFPYILYMIHISRRGTLMRIFYVFCTLFFVCAIYFTYTRGVWLAILVLPVFIFIIHYKKVLTAYLATLLAILCIGIYLAKDSKYLTYAPNYDTTIYHANLDDHLKATFSGEDMSTMERFYRWIAAIKSVPQYGLFGAGPNTFNTVYKAYTVSSFQTYISKNEERSTVHNYTLLMLTEQGVMGAILYLILVGYILFFIQKYYHYSSGSSRLLLLAIACSQIVFLINNCFSDLVESNKVGSLFYINLAWLILWRQSSEKTR